MFEYDCKISVEDIMECMSEYGLNISISYFCRCGIN